MVRSRVRTKYCLLVSVCRLSTVLVFSALAAMAEQQQFYLLLGNLMSPDNNIRKHSEVRQEHTAVFLGDDLGSCSNEYSHISKS